MYRGRVDAITEYAGHSVVTDPGSQRALLGELPGDVAAVREIVAGLVIHSDMGALYGLDLSARLAEPRLRTVEAMLARLAELDRSCLVEPRAAGTRLVGNCRASTVLFCALLRELGIPVRARCGFSNYFTSPIRGDHWVAEYWSASHSRWVLVDAELDDEIIANNRITFDPMDTPRAQFWMAGEAWLACRRGDEDPDSFGLDPATTGDWYVRGQLLRDLAALNKVEVAPWDTWWIGAPQHALTPEETALLDHLAHICVSCSNTHGAPTQTWHEDSRLWPPPEYQQDP